MHITWLCNVTHILPQILGLQERFMAKSMHSQGIAFAAALQCVCDLISVLPGHGKCVAPLE